MNENNLVPQNKRTKSEQREIARKGGKASGEARNFAKSMRQALETELQTDDGKANGYEKIGRAVIAKAKRGDVQAAAFVAKIIGEDVTRIADVSDSEPFIIVVPADWSEAQRDKWLPIITQCSKRPCVPILEDEVEDAQRSGADAILQRMIFVGIPDPSND